MRGKVDVGETIGYRKLDLPVTTLLYSVARYHAPKSA